MLLIALIANQAGFSVMQKPHPPFCLVASHARGCTIDSPSDRKRMLQDERAPEPGEASPEATVDCLFHTRQCAAVAQQLQPETGFLGIQSLYMCRLEGHPLAIWPKKSCPIVQSATRKLRLFNTSLRIEGSERRTPGRWHKDTMLHIDLKRHRLLEGKKKKGGGGGGREN
jgi:hypothetical protein